ncbi:hypothetical protein [Lewinella sp. W8]|uniref:hypothetical protein n=1 Tax=Lewinella sp. W8 TaxID=2528208 RepID=UPI0010675F87|nr:hypothetical protein [Lewinella sp. W8]MTB50099.1 hypothetical protein [Lewinella sp. W8]
MQFKLPLFLSLLLFPLVLSSQDFHLRAELGSSAFTESSVDAARAFDLGLEYHLPAGQKLTVFAGLGWQHNRYRDVSRENIPCDFPLGIKVITFAEDETYTIRRHDLTATVGAAYALGRINFRSHFTPAFRIADRVTYTSELDFNTPGRPNNFVSLTLRPGEIRREGSVGSTIDYTSRWNFQAGADLLYRVGGRGQVGVSYRQIVSNFRLFTKTVEFCGANGCEPVDFENSSVDAAISTLSLRFLYRL